MKNPVIQFKKGVEKPIFKSYHLFLSFFWLKVNLVNKSESNALCRSMDFIFSMFSFMENRIYTYIQPSFTFTAKSIFSLKIHFECDVITVLIRWIQVWWYECILFSKLEKGKVVVYVESDIWWTALCLFHVSSNSIHLLSISVFIRGKFY